MKHFISVLAFSLFISCGIANAQGIVTVGNSVSSNKTEHNTSTMSSQYSPRIADRPTGAIVASVGIGIGGWGPGLTGDAEYTFVNFGGGLSLSAGLYGAVGIRTTTTYSNGSHPNIYAYVGPELGIHWAVVEQLDVFTKAIPGYYYYSFYSIFEEYDHVSGFNFGALLGATYYINKSIGVGGTIGTGIPSFSAHVAFRL